MIQYFLLFSVPFLSGITYLAYKHPYVYKKLRIGTAVVIIYVACLVTNTLWDFAINLTLETITPFIKEDNIGKVSDLVKTLKIDAKFSLYFYLSLGALWWYSFFLVLLQDWLKEEKEQKNN